MNSSKNLPSGDWRAGYRTAFENVPRAPRTPGPLAKELIYAYQGGQKALRNIGLIFLAIGLIFFAPNSEGAATDMALNLTSKSTVGTITYTHLKTNVSINDEHPTEIKYRYVLDGEQYEETSYAYENSSDFSIGTAASIQYFPLAPSLSRAKGTSSCISGNYFIFFLLFPLAGLGVAAWAARSNRREIRAFRNGMPCRGLITKRAEDESTEINGRHPFEIHWEFQVDGMTYKGKLSHMDRPKLESAFPEDEVTVLYDPHDPKINTVWLEG